MRNVLKTMFAALTLLMFGVPAYATTIEFTGVGVPLGNGGFSGITVIDSLHASGDIAISQMIVSGSAFDGTYTVTGAAAYNNFGRLTFDAGSDTVTLVGGVASLGVLDGTQLLTGTGPFSSLSITNPACGPHNCPDVSFDAPTILDADLLTALGISGNAWNLSSHYTADGTGNAFPQTSADALNTQVVSDIPEPATLLILGTGLFGLGLMRWRKAA